MWRLVCFAPSPHYDVDVGKCREELLPNDLPQAPFDGVPLDAVAAVLGHDEADPWMMQKGSDDPELEVLGPDALPFASYRT